MNPQIGYELTVAVSATCPGCNIREKVSSDRIEIIQNFPNSSRQSEMIAVIEVKCKYCKREYDVQLSVF